MYQAQQSTPGGPAGPDAEAPGGAEEAKPDADDVIDAEFVDADDKPKS